MSTVLIVDNHEGFRRSIRRMLELSGFNVFEAGSGTEALQILADESVNVVLTDLNMPTMPGMDLIYAIRSSSKYDRVGVFVLSVTCTDARVAEAVDAGANGYLQKPLDVDDFAKQAEPFLDKE